MVDEKTIMVVGTILVLLVPGACAVSLVGVGSFVNDIEAQSMEEVNLLKGPAEEALRALQVALKSCTAAA